MLTTTPAAIALIKSWEKFSPQAYFDSIGSEWTIGYGTTRYANGDEVTIGDEITDDDAEMEMFNFVRKEIEPALNRHFSGLGLQPSWRDAICSLMYNLRNGTNPDRSFPRTKALILKGAPVEEIADEWVTADKGGGKRELGLYRRRLSEVLVLLGKPWQVAHDLARGAEFSTNWRDLANWKPAPAVDAELFDELEIPKRGADPTPETPMTMDDAQYLSAQAVGYEGSYADWIGHRVVVSKRNAIEAPNVDLKADPKAVEDSETGRGYAKEVSGKDDVRLAAIATGASTTAAVASGLSKDVSTAMENTRTIVAGATVMQLVTIGLIIGIPFMLYGLWKIYRGRDIKEEGRAIATQPKV